MKLTGTCFVCGKHYEKKQKTQKYCSKECKKISIQKYNGSSSLNHLSVGRVGDVSELEMCAFYVREGYEVFRNVSSNGPADIIIWKPENNELHILDIKSYVKPTDPNTFIIREESRNDFVVKVIPYDYNSKEPLRPL